MDNTLYFLLKKKTVVTKYCFQVQLLQEYAFFYFFSSLRKGSLQGRKKIQ